MDDSADDYRQVNNSVTFAVVLVIIALAAFWLFSETREPTPRPAPKVIEEHEPEPANEISLLVEKRP